MSRAFQRIRRNTYTVQGEIQQAHTGFSCRETLHRHNPESEK